MFLFAPKRLRRELQARGSGLHLLPCLWCEPGSFNETNPLEFDLRAFEQQEKEANGATTIQAALRGLQGRNSAHSLRSGGSGSKVQRLQQVERKLDRLIGVMQDLQRELQELREQRDV